MTNWYQKTCSEVFDLLETSSDGLTSEKAEQRLEEYGANELPSTESLSPWPILLAQFKNILIVILLIAIIVSYFLGHTIESIVIAVIVLFSILLGFIQEYRAERAMEALHEMAAPTAIVVRGGIENEMPARDLVPGDLILLRTGARVPADARLIQAANLKMNESALTGESLAIEKNCDALRDKTLSTGDRKNMVHSGTDIVYGRGTAVVVATGLGTEFGKITGMLQAIDRGRTPLQENLDHIGKVLAIAAGLIVIAIVVLSLLRGAPFLEMFIFGIALAVAAVPEALPAVVTISLAIGMQRMVKRNALVRYLPTVETLGSTAVICSDKTGTLTKDEMTIRKLWVNGHTIRVTGSGYEPEGKFELHDGLMPLTEPVIKLLRCGALANDANLIQIDGHWEIKGDPTEGAFIVAAAKAGLDKQALEEACPRIDEIPFSSESKRMITLHQSSGGTFACAKGAPEVIINACSKLLTEQGEEALDETNIQNIRSAAQQMASEALRVLAVAVKPDTNIEEAELGMTFLGIVGLIDPARPEAKEAIRTCEQAGITPIMITGDHPQTARAVASELGILKDGRVVIGADIETMSADELEKNIGDIEVYARVSPEHKLRIVDAWQKSGLLVAMTGDGVNDAPALKKADIGIAMGITGTDVSREAADMTLTDDNFASIVAAVEEGRGIFNNIKKYLMYLLSSNIGEIGLMACATLAGLPLPLTAVQILYVNLATDGLPALALAVDPQENDLMDRLPRDPATGIFTRPVVILMIVGGLWSMLVNIGLFTWALHSDRGLSQAMTMTFLSLVLIQFFKAYNFRSDRQSVFVSPFANSWLNIAILWELSLLAIIVYVPFLQIPFGTYSLPLQDWGIVVLLAFTVVPILEITKWMVRKGFIVDRERIV
jgi:P-type Ca2+ transporter type 2C